MTTGHLRRSVVFSAAIDIALIVVFVVLGRGFHREVLDLAGFLVTAWPFVAALAVAWLVTRAWRNPERVVRPGIGIWIVTVSAGVLLRVVSGQGAVLSFVIVASVVIGVFLVGWRAIALLVSSTAKAPPL